jgi:hypothetical protein
LIAPALDALLALPSPSCPWSPDQVKAWVHRNGITWGHRKATSPPCPDRPPNLHET